KHQGNGAHDKDGAAQVRQPERRTALHPPMRSTAVWGPIAAVTALAILAIIGVWHRVSERHDEKNFVQRTTPLAVNVGTAKPHENLPPVQRVRKKLEGGHRR